MTTALDIRPSDAPENVVYLAGDDLLVFLDGGSGWAGYVPKGARSPEAFVRLVPDDPDGQHRHYDIVELYMASPVAVTGRTVRGLPLGRIEAAANHPINAERIARLAVRRSGPLGLVFDFDLDKLARLRANPTTDSALADRPERGRRPRMRLKVPDGHRKPDDFYEQVAYRYGWLQGEGLKPAQELAAANDVPVTTVHRWIKEARRRGLMAPGQRASRKEQL